MSHARATEVPDRSSPAPYAAAAALGLALVLAGALALREGAALAQPDPVLVAIAVLVVALVVSLVLAVRRSLTARSVILTGPIASAEVAVVERGQGKIALLASGEAARECLAATADRLELLGPHPGLPRLVRHKEHCRSSELVLEVGRAGPLTPALSPGIAGARRIMGALLQVLERLHAAGFVVGDLPPGSLCVRPDGSVLLLLLAPPAGTAPSSRASPEVTRGLVPQVEDDVFSACAILVELLTALPFPQATRHELEQTLDRSAVDPALEQLLLRCLGPREERPRSVAELRADLDAMPWRAGFAAELHARVRAIRSDHRLDLVEARREAVFMDRVSSDEAGDFSLTLRSLDVLDVAFEEPVEGGFLETGTGRVLGTVRRGRAPVSLRAIDLRELAQHGVFLRAPSGERLDLSAATVARAPASFEDLAKNAPRGLEAWLTLVRGRPRLALRFLATGTLLRVLEVPDDEGGPPFDIRSALEDEVARRLLQRTAREPGPGGARFLESILGAQDPARALLEADALDESATLEERARAHVRTLSRIASAPAGRLREPARHALAALEASGVLVLEGTTPIAGLVCGLASRARVLGQGSGPFAPRRSPGSDRRALDRAFELASAMLGDDVRAPIELDDPAWDARLATVPVFIEVALEKAERRPLPPLVALAAPLNRDGRLEPIGASLESVVEASVAAGARLLFVPRGDVEAAQALRTTRGVTARDMVIAGLPDVSPRELFEFVGQRTAEHFPSQHELDLPHARRLLDAARHQIALGRTELALASLAFLRAALASRNKPHFARLRAACLAEIARCRNARGQWRLALEAWQEAEAVLDALAAAHDLDWAATELRFDLPEQRAACLVNAFAFDVAERALDADIRAKDSCALVSKASLARSHGTLGRLELEWAIASDGPEKKERFERAREHLSLALEKADEQERPRHLNWLGHLESRAGAFAEAERRYADALAADGHDAGLDPALDREANVLGRVALGLERGLGGERDALGRAEALGERALAGSSHSRLLRARLVRTLGRLLLERGEIARARDAFLESRGLLDALAESGSFLSDAAPDIELARLEALGGRSAEANRWIASALARLAAFRSQVTGVSPFATSFTESLAGELERARPGEAATLVRALDAVLARIPCL